MKTAKYFVLMISTLLLFGCNVTVTPLPKPSPSPSPTPSPSIAPSATPTPIPSATPSHTPSPTPTSTASSPYTILKSSTDSKLVYVAANGLDTNPGTIDKPVLTIFKGIGLLRKGFPDWLLLRRGDKFTQGFYSDPVGLSFNLSGRSATEPMVVTSYSDPKAPSNVRPEINSGTKNGFVTYGASNVELVGLNFHDTLRDPNSPDFISPVVSGPSGLRLGGNALNWLIEDCVFDSYAQGITLDAMGDRLYDFENLKVRYNIVKNSYSNNRSQGLYAGNVNGLLIEGNIFDHNGWTEQTDKTKTWNFMAQNHNVYLRQDNTAVIFRNNIVLSGADCGLEFRAGGVAQENLFVQNTCGMTIGLVNGATLLKGGVTAEVSENVILDGRADGVGSSCLELGNIISGKIHDNICAREVNDPKQYGYAIQMEAGNAVSNPTDGSGIQNTTVENNLVYAWSNGLYMEADLRGGAKGSAGFANLVIQNNEVQAIIRKTVQHEAPLSLQFETFRTNIYAASQGQTSGIFQVGISNVIGTTYAWPSFVKVLEPTAIYRTLPYPDPTNASVEAYDKSLGGAGTYSSFIQRIELLSGQNYQAALTTLKILPFLRSKFGK